jgi:hypothetical protein
MRPPLRKLALTAHVTVSVGWLGAAAAFLALAIAALASGGVETVRGAYVAMEVVGWYVIVPLCLAALVTGLVVSLGTPWGLFRHLLGLAEVPDHHSCHAHPLRVHPDTQLSGQSGCRHDLVHRPAARPEPVPSSPFRGRAPGTARDHYPGCLQAMGDDALRSANRPCSDLQCTAAAVRHARAQRPHPGGDRPAYHERWVESPLNIFRRPRAGGVPRPRAFSHPPRAA